MTPLEARIAANERLERERKAEMNKFIGFVFFALILVIPCVIWLFGSENPMTPAGYMGYVTQDAVFGEAQFIKIQKGPVSTGRGWLLGVQNISVTPYTYTEELSGVLAKDSLSVGFRVHIIWKVNPEKVVDFVEKYTTLYDSKKPDAVVQGAYNNFLKEPVRTFARNEVQKYASMEVKDHINEIGISLMENVQALVKGTPFLVSSVVVGSIVYPKEVEDAVSAKLAATQSLEQKKIEVESARADAEKRVAEAEGIAKAMQIVQTKLTTLYLQHEAIEAQKLMANGQNHTVVYIPSGANGVPLVRLSED